MRAARRRSIGRASTSLSNALVLYGKRGELTRFLDAGCPRLLLSHPGASSEDVDATIVAGINQDSLNGREKLVSAASCTTNAIVPLLDLLDREVGIEQALLTTLHSVMNDQPLIDGYHHDDLRRTRSAMQSIIPVIDRPGPRRRAPAAAAGRPRPGQGDPRADHQCLGHRPDHQHPAPGIGAQHQRPARLGGARPAQVPYRLLRGGARLDRFQITTRIRPSLDGSQTRTAGTHLVNLFGLVR